MKISSMLEREDFYAILQDTLRDFYGDKTAKKNQLLYLYPHLNAGITRRPSKRVKNYLICEYRVKGCLAKRMAVRIYLFLMLNSFGCLAAKKMIYAEDYITNDILIYPCNRKIRIFNFNSKKVDVIVKTGFAKDCIQKEIVFRTQNQADFIWPLEKWCKNGYREAIIEGTPLARYKGDIKVYQQKAICLLNRFAENRRCSVELKTYINMLQQKIQELLLRAGMPEHAKIIDMWIKQWYILDSYDRMYLQLIFSHGDMQNGNIWIEEKSNRIIIIDWESWDMRSVDYDKIVLFTDIRQTNKYDKIYDEIVTFSTELNYYIFVLEDVLYKLNEMKAFPESVMSAEYEKYFQEWQMAMRRLKKRKKKYE